MQFRIIQKAALQNSYQNFGILLPSTHKKVKVKQSSYRPGVAQRVPGS
jgi:hypothetical protein